MKPAKDVQEARVRVAQLGKQVVDVLEDNGLTDCARTLRRFLAKMDYGAVADMCHVKYLGDVYVKKIGDSDWMRLVGSLQEAAVTAAAGVPAKKP